MMEEFSEIINCLVLAFWMLIVCLGLGFVATAIEDYFGYKK